MRRLDIGVLSYKRLEPLQRTIASMLAKARCDLRIFVIHNPCDGDVAVRSWLEDALLDPRIHSLQLPENRGYAGGVNALFGFAETEYIAYCDNDVNFLTPGWDEQLCGLLDRHHELGMVFPNGGHYPIDRGDYQECMWCAGFCWVLSRAAMKAVGPFDETLGHHEEVDYATRMRMAGLRLGSLPGVHVAHEATHTNDPQSVDRIRNGVVNWVNKWCERMTGKMVNYHSPNVLRHDDWHPNELYLEEFWKTQPGFAGVNSNPEPCPGKWAATHEFIKVPRLKGFYWNRFR